MQAQDWRPSASIEVLKKRASVIQSIRQFFVERKVLEVETPTLSPATVTDQHLHSFDTRFNNPLLPQASTLYLQTSPEFAMKRLLCAGSGPIYQICKSFRNEETGRFHNPEFTMLEWYRPGFDHLALMTEIDQLIQMLLGCEAADVITYQQAFLKHLHCDPLTADLTELKQLASQYGYAELAAKETDKDTLLNLLFSQHVEAQIGQDRPCFVMNFPASQAALAQIDPIDCRVAQRFELYFKGVELANGFHELTDEQEQLGRFQQDNNKRLQAGLPPMPIDTRLIAALTFGLPDCAGVALGIDRLLMLILGRKHISEVIAFDSNHA